MDQPNAALESVLITRWSDKMREWSLAESDEMMARLWDAGEDLVFSFVLFLLCS